MTSMYEAPVLLSHPVVYSTAFEGWCRVDQLLDPWMPAVEAYYMFARLTCQLRAVLIMKQGRTITEL